MLCKNQPFDEVIDNDSDTESIPSDGGSNNDSHSTIFASDNEEYEQQLQVSPEIKQMFAYISAYKPQDIELETKLKPFIPEYIAAVGELDPFLKVPRPDGKPDYLGLKVLDEPAAQQSDPTVVTLSISYRDVKSSKPVTVINSVDQAEKNTKRIQKWIEDIRELHKTKPPPTVNYSKTMPDITQLMQAWPEPFEEVLQSLDLPSADMDLDLEQYIKFVCSILDIPVYANPIESLHLLFALYYEFKSNQHFSQQMEQMNL
jgi:intraflagellar transport protein 46